MVDVVRSVPIGVVVFCCSTVLAQSPSETMNPAAFVRKAGLMHIAELELGKIAEQRATHPEVRILARHVVADHTASQADLIKAASLTSAALPMDADKAHTERKAALTSKSGADFDRAYVEHVTTSHEEAVAFLLDAATHQADPSLKQWAVRAAPGERAHLNEAKRIKPLLTSPDRSR